MDTLGRGLRRLTAGHPWHHVQQQHDHGRQYCHGPTPAVHTTILYSLDARFVSRKTPQTVAGPDMFEFLFR